jgi:hypothetical protein
MFWAIPMVALVVLAWRIAHAGRARAGERFNPVDLATGVALILLALAVNTSFLRGSLLSRFGDAIVPVALLGAWATTSTPNFWQVRRTPLLIAWVMPRVLLLMILALAFATGDTRRELQASGLTDSWEFTQRRFQTARTELSQLPPNTWSGTKPDGTLVAARYVAECTRPEDYVLLVTYAPEIPVFARRRFAAGQGTFGLNFYTAEEQQRNAVNRLREQSVPVVLGSFDEYEGEFVEDYPIVAKYVTEHYRDAGTIDVEGEPRFRVLVDSTRQPTHVDGILNLPCYR